MGTPGSGTSTYAAAGGWVSEFTRTTGVNARVVPEDGTVLRFRWLKNGTIDLFVESSGVARHMEAYRPEQALPDGGPFQFRIIGPASISAWGIVVRGDSPIKTIYDIKPTTKVA